MSKDGLEVSLSVLYEVPQRGPRVLGGRKILPSACLGGQRTCHSLLLGSALSTFLIILGDLLLGTQTANKIPFF